MSAQEIIEQIKALPPQERAVVVDFVQHLDEPGAVKQGPISESELHDAADRIFSRHDELFRKLAK
ncbi:MAG TPA: hypothetical protein VK968_12035 [Roseimicrobium sp.]|nr:hypothetical protein [Roseimicrobium sp.]